MRDSSPVDATIRRYREEDEPAVVALSLRAWDPVFASTRDVLGDVIFQRLYGDNWSVRQQQDVEKVLRDQRSTVWVAEELAEIVGFVAAIVDHDPDIHMGEIKMLAVDPDSQNHGVGTQLTDHATDWLRQSGMRVVVVSTGGDVGHAPARRTYEKAGYTPFPAVNFFKPV
jgi:GNAT superfamily N-acetyltransferase